MSRILFALSSIFFLGSALIACTAHLQRAPTSGPAKPAMPYPAFEAGVATLEDQRVGAAIHLGGPQHALVLNRGPRVAPPMLPTPSDPDMERGDENLEFDDLDVVTQAGSR